MCGIFGFVLTKHSNISYQQNLNFIRKLFLISQSRGRESSGFSIKNYHKQTIVIHKKAIPAKKLLKNKETQKIFYQFLKSSFNERGNINETLSFIAHTRLVTNGLQNNNNNNQPIIKNSYIAVHNGIVTNVDKLWETNKSFVRSYEVDTEIILALLDKYQQDGLNIDESIYHIYQNLEGANNVAIQFSKNSAFLISTNNGSLYYILNPDNGYFIFASEHYFLTKCIDLIGNKNLSAHNIQWLKPNTSIIIDENTLQSYIISLNNEVNHTFNLLFTPINFNIINTTPDKPVDFNEIQKIIHINKTSPLRNLLEYNIEEIKNLKRCSRCILPETFPFIEFDQHGVCNYCNNYTHKRIGNKTKEEEFRKLLDQYRNKEGYPECIVPFSGGRDSSYGLHYLVRELNIRPIAYTYDWGMVNDLARRNASRLCGKLGIEHILVSADIKLKRKYIRENVNAWLRNPQLGIIPLFMAGDKQFFYYVNKIKKQTQITLDIWCTNYLENTDFKAGFCNVRPSFDKNRPDYLPLSSQLKMAWYYLKNYIKNPAYLNSSLIDTVFSFYAYYAEPRRHFFQIYDWIEWNEERILQTLINEYEWETSPDTISTWRIGDGTAPFYNYIYFTVAGFSEIETFRSNQIREGMISRDKALALALEENSPRFESLKWYLDTIEIDFKAAIKTINSIPKLYRK